MITLLCSCLAARVDIYTVKRLANEEWLCHWSCLGNKADHSISLPLSHSFRLSCCFLTLSSFILSLLHCTSTHHSFLCFILSLHSVWMEQMRFCCCKCIKPLLPPYPPPLPKVLCGSWRCASNHL